jgi:hypothetical protein
MLCGVFVCIEREMEGPDIGSNAANKAVRKEVNKLPL